MPDTPEESGVKNSRKQATTSTTNAQDSRLCLRCKQYLKKDCPELPYCLNVELKATSQQSVLPNNRTADGRTKDTKKLMKDAKFIEKIRGKHGTDPSSPTEPTNALTVQATMEHVIVQQDSNHTHPPLATLLAVQVFTKIIHNFKIIHPNNTHNKMHPWWAYQPPP